MKFDKRIRIVSIYTLGDICFEASKHSNYSYEVDQISNRFVSVSCWWKNDRENAMTVMFPVVPLMEEKGVMLHIHRVIANPRKNQGATPEIAFSPLTCG